MTDETEQSLVKTPKRMSTGGRPKIAVNQRDADKVFVLRAADWRVEDIAEAMGMCEENLYKLFRAALVDGRKARLMLEAETLYTAAEAAVKTGRPSSVRLFIELLAKHRAANHGAGFGDPEPDTPAALGKKAAERAAAEATMNSSDDDEWGHDLDPSRFN